jgi:bloom syndrome protein
MTRSNLGEHIAWLLANGVTPVQAITSTNLTPTAGVVHGGRVEEEEEELEQDTPRPPPVPAQNRRLAPSVTVIQEFARPALPSTIVPKPQPQGSLGDNSMGKLSSASKSTRPGLLSQHQLATPASTSNSAAASSSLTKNYATFLRESNCLFARECMLVD